MTTFRSEEMVVGAIALASIFWIARIIVRAGRDRRLPIGKGEIKRDERPGAFRALLSLYVVAGAAMLWVGMDLIFGVRHMLGIGTS